MWCTSQLTSAREDFELRHDADTFIESFECDSSSNMCFGCSKEPSHRNGETVLLSTQDKCLLRNQVICQLRILIWRSDNFLFFVCFLQENIPKKTAANRLSLLFKILNAIRRRICISILCCRLVYWSKTCSGDLCIFRSSDVMRSYLVRLETFCYFLSFTHVNLNETTYIEDFRHPASRSRIEQKFICAVWREPPFVDVPQRRILIV